MKVLPTTVDWCGECPYDMGTMGFHKCKLQTTYGDEIADWEVVFSSCPLDDVTK